MEFETCDFCLSINRADQVSKVKEAVIDKSPGYQAFTSLLRDLFGCAVNNFQVICFVIFYELICRWKQQIYVKFVWKKS